LVIRGYHLFVNIGLDEKIFRVSCLISRLGLPKDSYDKVAEVFDQLEGKEDKISIALIKSYFNEEVFSKEEEFLSIVTKKIPREGMVQSLYKEINNLEGYSGFDLFLSLNCSTSFSTKTEVFLDFSSWLVGQLVVIFEKFLLEIQNRKLNKISISDKEISYSVGIRPESIAILFNSVVFSSLYLGKKINLQLNYDIESDLSIIKSRMNDVSKSLLETIFISNLIIRPRSKEEEIYTYSHKMESSFSTIVKSNDRSEEFKKDLKDLNLQLCLSFSEEPSLSMFPLIDFDDLRVDFFSILLDFYFKTGRISDRFSILKPLISSNSNFLLQDKEALDAITAMEGKYRLSRKDIKLIALTKQLNFPIFMLSAFMDLQFCRMEMRIE